MPALNSSYVVNAEYDADRSTLTVMFGKGEEYEYYGVAEHVYEDLMSAIDPGEYFREFIKYAGYQYTKVG